MTRSQIYIGHVDDKIQQNTTSEQNTALNNRCKILIHSMYASEKFMIYYCLIQVAPGPVERGVSIDTAALTFSSA